MKRAVMDTCVLLDYFARRDPYWEDVLKLRIAQVFGDVEWWASPHSYLDMLYILRRAVPVDRVRSALAASLDFVQLCTLSQHDIKRALTAGWSDAEDCVVSLCADNIDADFIVTRNKDDFTRAKVSVLTPEELLQWLKDEQGFDYDMVEMPLDSDHRSS